MTYKKLTRNQHFKTVGPKRILALDGGGLRGIVTLGYLKKIEDLLRERHGGAEDFRLAHYFDLIAGTSTGSIIAAGLALGMTANELTDLYMKLGKDVFRRSSWRKGILRARYSHEKLTDHLQQILGKTTTLGDSDLLTGLLVMTKRMDTGSPWPLSNNPKAKYYQAKAGQNWISNKDYPLWKVVRASSAAPSYFDPEKITISRKKGFKVVDGVFVDGGVSPFNNPTLQAFMFATLQGFNVDWNTGADQLLVVSVGTGRGDFAKEPTWITAKGAVQSLLSLMEDAGELVEIMAQWLSTGHTHRAIDKEIGSLEKDFIGDSPQFTYSRFNLSLEPEEIGTLKHGIAKNTAESLIAMDEPKNMPLLKELADIDSSSKVHDKHFPSAFDLT